MPSPLLRSRLLIGSLPWIPLLMMGCPFDPPVMSGADGSSSGSTGAPADTATGVDEPDSTAPGDDAPAGRDDDTSSSGDADESTDGPPDDDTSTGEPPNQAPTAIDDGPYSIEAGNVLEVGELGGVLANDLDPEGSPLTVTRWQTPTDGGGMVAMLPNGTFSYLPPPGLAYGTDRFEYTVADDEGQEATARVRIVVQAAGGAVGLGELGSHGTTIDGIDVSDQSGYSARDAGDVNGDGFADLLIGAFQADPASGSNAGEAYLVFGGSEPPAQMSLADADVRFEGIGPSDSAGRFVDGAGDVNGDGFADILIGAYGGDPNGLSAGGETYLVFGGDSLPAVVGLADADVRFDGIGSGDQSGWSVDGPGDVDGDGFADILIGAYLADNTGGVDAGEVYLVRGGDDLPAVVSLANADTRFEGINAYDYAGHAVSGAGDVDGDGYADILIGAYGGDPNGAGSGEAYLVFGGPELPTVMSLADADVRFDGIDASDAAGFAAQGVGDVDGDGFADILIGAYQADPSGAADGGESYLLYGGPGLPPLVGLANADVRFDGIDGTDHSGMAMSPAGDVDGDGYADFLIGAPDADPAGASGAGETSLILGGPALASVVDLADADLRFDGIDPSDYSGRAVSGAGDVDGDGFDDLLVGAFAADPGGHSSAGQSYLARGDDLMARVAILGTPYDDDLPARNGVLPDIIVAGRGDDRLLADGGPDVLRGGEGDDTLVIVDGEFFRVNGGLGYDTLELGLGMLLSPASLSRSRVVGIEAIRLSPAGASLLTLTELTVLNLSDTSNTLTIDGDGDDQVLLDDGSWFGPVPEGGYAVYLATSTQAVLRVSPSVSVTLP
ncbi:MAG: FG-GAP repeat protein [Myxococcales bacterium]|nr:FG-GAP repeat protein [Myxococcales bacterium]